MEESSSRMQDTGIYSHVYVDMKKPRFSFSDIAGYGSVKEKFKDMLVLPFKYPAALKKANVALPTGVIVWGPLGVGKGHLIEASAKEANVNFVIIRGRETTANSEAIREGFKLAVENKPCMIHVMDIDWLAPRKDADYGWSDGTTSGMPDKLATQEVHKALYEEVAKVADLSDVMVAASCYRIDVLDQAFTRIKMLGRKIYVPRPDKENRKEILKHYLGEESKKIDLNRLADMTEHFVGWDLEALYRKAKLVSLQKNSGKLKLETGDFREALKSVKPWLSKEMAGDYGKIFSQDCIHKYNF